MSWEQQAVWQQVDVAERMLRKFNPYHVDNWVPRWEDHCNKLWYELITLEELEGCAQRVKPLEEVVEEVLDDDPELGSSEDEYVEQATDWMFDGYQYQQWLVEQYND